MAHNLRDLGRLRGVMQRSLIKRLAAKFKISVRDVCTGGTETRIRNEDGAIRSVIEIRVGRDNQPPLIARWGGVSLKWGIATTLEDRLTPFNQSTALSWCNGCSRTPANCAAAATCRSASRSGAEGPGAERAVGKAAVGQADGGATSKDARAVPSVPHGPPCRQRCSGRLDHSTLESRMMRKYQVRFGGGLTEKAGDNRTSPAAYATVSRTERRRWRTTAAHPPVEIRPRRPRSRLFHRHE